MKLYEPESCEVSSMCKCISYDQLMYKQLKMLKCNNTESEYVYVINHIGQNYVSTLNYIDIHTLIIPFTLE